MKLSFIDIFLSCWGKKICAGRSFLLQLRCQAVEIFEEVPESLVK